MLKPHPQNRPMRSTATPAFYASTMFAAAQSPPHQNPELSARERAQDPLAQEKLMISL